MSLSARTSDNDGQPLGEGYVKLATSAGNALFFRNPADAYSYKIANAGQFDPIATGNYNDENQNPTP